MSGPSADVVAPAFSIEHVDGHGRVMRATRDLAPGDTVLRESPSLAWPHDNVDQLISGFLGASAQIQAALLDMAAPDVDSGLDEIDSEAARRKAVEARAALAAERRQLAERLADCYDGQRALELIEHLLLIADCNAHAFEGRSGLFPIAAKADHSCEPNCGHSTRVGGEMHFFATRPIRAGDDVTISYLDDVWATSRETRRRTLLVQKRFFCKCTRCSRAPAEPLLEESGDDAVRATLPERLARLECVAAGCAATDGYSGGCSPHAPCPDLVGEAVTAYLACCAEAAEAERRNLRLAAATTRALGRQISLRYAQWAVLQFGKEDEAVARMLEAATGSS